MVDYKKAMNFITRRIFKNSSIFTKNIFNYGEIAFTQSLYTQSDYPHIPAYRAYDLDGKLLDKNVKYDLD